MAHKSETVAPFPILYEDNHLLVIQKPAGLLSQADHSKAEDALSQARAYLKSAYHKPGNVYLGLVQRLDRNVSGVMLFARTSKAAARISADIREHRIMKGYLALVDGTPDQNSGELHNFMRKDHKKKIARAARATETQAKEARLRFELKQKYARDQLPSWIKCITKEAKDGTDPLSLLEIELLTGRFHQIRFQLSQNIGPIVGDLKYGSHWQAANQNIYLHCHKLSLQHPVLKTLLNFESPQPAHWFKQS